jgi:hypothetical protein
MSSPLTVVIGGGFRLSAALEIVAKHDTRFIPPEER